MAWTTIAAVYFVTWWVVLFAILPWGIKSQAELGDDMPPGTDPGAPHMPRLGLKMIWTTIVATALFGAVYFVFYQGWLSIDDMASWLGMPDTGAR